MKQYNVPSGFKDLILGECQSRSELQQLILSVFKKWGYREIVTPIVEYYDTYVTGFKEVNEQEFYKVLDSSNRILALRADMTIPIVRVAASRFNNAQLPLRFSYSASVYKPHKALSGMMNEMTDCGVELIGLTAEESDLEILLTAVDVLKALNRPFTFEIGNINYFAEACNEMNITEEVKATLADLIGNKQVIDLENYLAQLTLNDTYKEFFRELIFMSGKDALEKAEKFAFSEPLKAIVTDLNELKNKLNSFEEINLSFDFSKTNKLDYYTGLTFEAYILGIGSKVLSGGRYDKLCKKFGRDLPAVGFAIKLDTLITKAEKQDTIIITYPLNQQMVALKMASELRKENNVEMKIDNSLESIKVSKGDESCCK